MVGIGLCLLRSHESCGSAAMVAVGDVEGRHLRKLSGYEVYVVFLVNDPQLVAEVVDGGHKIVCSFGCSITGYQAVQHVVIGIGKKHGLYVGITHAHMLHAVLFLVLACELMLLDHAVKIVVHISSHHKPILRLAVHGLRVDVVVVLLVLLEPSTLLEQLKVGCGLVIDLLLILACAGLKIDLGLCYVVQALLVVASLCPGLFAVEHVVGTTFYLFHQLLWRSYSAEWFNCCHELSSFSYRLFVVLTLKLLSVRSALPFAATTSEPAKVQYKQVVKTKARQWLTDSLPTKKKSRLAIALIVCAKKQLPTLKRESVSCFIACFFTSFAYLLT